jgi:ribonuclease BN (tRNA processing enzyme)
LLEGQAFDGSILVSHLHWDHVQGIPFFTAGDRDDSRVDLYVPAQDGRSGEELLGLSMSPPSFPITPAGLLGRWSFHALEPGAYEIEGLTITAAEVAHKGGRTYGYRIADGSTAVAYLPDHLATDSTAQSLADLVAGVDMLVHDAQFLEPERRLADAYGHSTVDDAVMLAEKLGARSLLLFHHSPARTDDQLDAIGADVRAEVPVMLAREGSSIQVGDNPPA